jgi:choline dehydrogenase-like flavoprotein
MHKLWTAISDLDEVAARAYQRLYAARTERSNSFEVHGYLEQVPNPDSRIVLSDKRDAFGQRRAHLIWNLTDLDRRTATRAVELFAQAAGANDVGRVRVEVASEEVFPPGTDWGHHHMGTTRMDDNPRRGVADRFGKVHGVRNLYVAGSSVFPTSGCATPTLTLVALAARLADHLEKTYTGRKE